MGAIYPVINQVVILCGGIGSRLGLKIPKCLAPVNNKPLIEYILEEFKNQGVSKIHFCLGEHANTIIEYLQQKHDTSNMSWSFDPIYKCGTWKALQNAKNFLDNEFFVTYGDSVAFCDLEFMYWQYVESNQECMMSVSNYLSSDANYFINNNGEIDFTEETNYVEHGVSIMSKPCLDKDNQIINFSSYFQNNCLFEKVHFANSNYYQINTPEDLEKVNRVFKNFTLPQKYNFLDRDGTIIKLDYDIYQHMEMEINLNLTKQLDDSDCVIITNQPGKAKCKDELMKINIINNNARNFLLMEGKNVLFTHSCIHRDVDHCGDLFDDLRKVCDCRKPLDGMLIKSSKRININKDLSEFFGDTDKDEGCAKKFGIKFNKMYN